MFQFESSMLRSFILKNILFMGVLVLVWVQVLGLVHWAGPGLIKGTSILNLGALGLTEALE